MFKIFIKIFLLLCFIFPMICNANILGVKIGITTLEDLESSCDFVCYSYSGKISNPSDEMLATKHCSITLKNTENDKALKSVLPLGPQLYVLNDSSVILKMEMMFDNHYKFLDVMNTSLADDIINKDKLEKEFKNKLNKQKMKNFSG